MRKKVDLGGVFHPFGGLIGAPEATAGGRWSPWRWVRPEDAVDGLSGKFWAAMT